jgi:hypothetical protein
MAKVGNLDIGLGGYFRLFSYWNRWLIFKENVIDPMVVMI